MRFLVSSVSAATVLLVVMITPAAFAASCRDTTTFCSLMEEAAAESQMSIPCLPRETQQMCCKCINGATNDDDEQVKQAVQCGKGVIVWPLPSESRAHIASVVEALGVVDGTHRVSDGHGMYQAEIRVARAISNKTNMVVLDIGAHTGGWLSLLAPYAKGVTIYAFEPVANNAAELENSLETIYSEWTTGAVVHLGQMCADSSSGRKTFWKFWPNVDVGSEEVHADQFMVSAHSSLVKRETAWRRLQMSEDGLVKTSIPGVSIDDFCAARCIAYLDFVKIDVEGSELEVIKGAKEMLSQKRIGMLQFEYGGTFMEANVTLGQVVSILSSHGYTTFREVQNGVLSHIEEWTDAQEDWYAHNLLAVDAAAVPKYPPARFS